MKVRLHHQYIRFRLSVEEVADLVSGASISTGIIHGPMSIEFEVRLTADAGPSLSIQKGTTRVQMPKAWTSDWMESDTVGFEFEMPTEGLDSLVVVVEKDYPCAHTSEGKAVFGRPQKMPNQS